MAAHGRRRTIAAVSRVVGLLAVIGPPRLARCRTFVASHALWAIATHAHLDNVSAFEVRGIDDREKTAGGAEIRPLLETDHDPVRVLGHAETFPPNPCSHARQNAQCLRPHRFDARFGSEHFRELFIRPGHRSAQCRQVLLFLSPGHPHAVELCPAGSFGLQLIERRAPEPRILCGDSGSLPFLGRIHSTPYRRSPWKRV